MEAPGPPAELQAAPPLVLEAYVHTRILHFNSQPALQQRLGPEAAAALQAATQELLGQAAAGGGAASGAEAGAAAASAAAAFRPPELALVFKHDCLHLGCADLHCKLCEQNQSRKCGRHFAGKYLSGDSIQAACGAPIRVELVDRLTGRPVPQHDPLSLQGRPLLAAKSAPSDAQGYVHVPLVGGAAQLPDLSVTGSSEALLSGQRPPFALLVRALQGGEGAGAGERVAAIPPLVSEGFVVATPRVRSASKKAVPALGDHVSKLNCAKLKDLRRAASDAGVQGLALPLAAVNTVGEFRQLAVWAQEDPSRLDQVKKMLKLTKGWEEARDHALIAVGADERLRAFFPDDSLAAGLLFRCKDANIGLEAPLAALEAASDASGQRTLVATLLPQGGAGAAAGAAEDGAAAPDPARVAAMLTQAKACWARRGHPGWAILPLDTPAFERGCAHLHQVTLPPHLAATAVPQAAHTAASFLAAAAAPAALSQGSSGGTGSPTAVADAAPGSPQLSLPGAAAAGEQRATSPFAQQQMRHAFASLGVQSPGTPARPLGSPPDAALASAPASPFQAASASAAEGGRGDSSLTARLLHSLGPSVQPPPAQQLQPQAQQAQQAQRNGAVPPTPGLEAALAPAVVAKIISGLPSLNLFAPDGPLGVGAVAELEASAGGDGDRKVPHIPSLGAMFGSKDLALSNQSVDWEQLLREAYKPPSGRATPLPSEQGGPAGSRSPPPSPPLLPQQPSPTARAAATAALEAAGGPLGLLRALSHASAGSLGSLGSLAGPLGTLSAMEWEALFTDPNLGAALEHMEHMPGAGPAAAAEGGTAGAAAATPGGPPLAPLPALQSRSLGRILTPEWARLLSMSAADWQQLLQEHRQAQAAQHGGAAAAPDTAPWSEAGVAPAQQEQQGPTPPSGLGGSARGPSPPGGRSRRSTLGKRGALTPTTSGLQGMEGVEVEAAP
ncbi:CSE family protein [Chlorella sorokiniana]|uniref:CSE family protein n=1 Tax=Chlorella sorokiniana TaxID=3076 RepID=A0A2P6TVK1_CHLSO|nr:CSE family protein [Chlorella sorokiniana]|eukprot:PRW58095.1 CSE family protein [Chlorella sorokiniana]